MWPGRFEWCWLQKQSTQKTNIRIILDGAHNEEGIRTLCSTVKLLSEKSAEKTIFIFQCMQASNAPLLLELLQSTSMDIVFPTTLNSSAGGVKSDELLALYPQGSIGGSCKKSIQKAQQLLGGAEGKIVVCGSLRLIAEFRDLLFH